LDGVQVGLGGNSQALVPTTAFSGMALHGLCMHHKIYVTLTGAEEAINLIKALMVIPCVSYFVGPIGCWWSLMCCGSDKIIFVGQAVETGANE